MISYLYSKKVLKKAIIKIKDENIKSVNSLNRVVSSNIFCGTNYPTRDNAAFDGYAINSQDTKNIKKSLSKKFKIIGLIAAGNKPFKKKIKRFDAVEIMTGSIIPKGFDTIIPIEQIIFLRSSLKINLLRKMGLCTVYIEQFLCFLFMILFKTNNLNLPRFYGSNSGNN